MNPLSFLGGNTSSYRPSSLTPAVYLGQSSPLGRVTSNSVANNPFDSQTTSDRVTLSQAGIALSKRAEDLGSSTMNAAQQFLTDFASRVLGASANGATISYDSATVSASSAFAAYSQHSSSASGTSDVTAVGLQDQSDFVGRGTITTADGLRYTFEVEVHYQATIAAASATQANTSTSTSSVATGSSTPAKAATSSPAKSLDFNFPGSAGDLGKLFEYGQVKGRFHIPAESNEKLQERQGQWLLRLLNSAAPTQTESVGGATAPSATSNALQ